MACIDEETRGTCDAVDLAHTKISASAQPEFTDDAKSTDDESVEIGTLGEKSPEELVQHHSPSSLIRTDSQARAQAHLSDVLRRLEGHQEPMRHLKENMSQLIARIGQEGTSPQDAKNMLVDCRRIARNRGEDLLDDMLALDSLSGLLPQGRKERKAAVACLDAFLGEVDAVKSDLVALEKGLHAKLQDPKLVKEPLVMDVGSAREGSNVEAMQLDSPRSLDRTDSQMQKQVQLQDVFRRLEEHHEPMQRLREKVSRLAARMSQDETCLDDEKQVLEDCRKLARNRGEDLLEDMVSLDRLSELLPQDRRNRKAAIARLDAFLGEVDTVKSDLAGLDKCLTARMSRENSAKQKPATWPSGGNLPAVAGEKPKDSNVKGTITRPHSPQVPAPPHDFWEQLELPLQFRSSEERSCYTLTSRASKFQAEEIKLELSPDASGLTISGVHLPTAAELQEMQDNIAQHLHGHGQTSLSSRAANQIYARFGDRSFGRFSETLTLPRDVDVTRIEASCVEGILHVKLPKRIRQTRSSHNTSFGRPFLW